MNKTNKSSLILKIILLVPLVALLGAICFTLLKNGINWSKFKKEEEPVYRVELDFQLSSYGENNVQYADVNLTPDNPSVTLDKIEEVAPFCYIRFRPIISIKKYNHEKDAWQTVQRFQSNEIYKNIEDCRVTYNIETEGEIIKSSFWRNIKEYYKEIWYNENDETLYYLTNIDGIHTIKFYIPKNDEYKTDAIEFEVRLNVGKDSRPNTSTISLEGDGVKKYDAEETDFKFKLDYYTINSSAQFTVKDFLTNEVLNSLDLDVRIEIYRYQDGKFRTTQMKAFENSASVGLYYCVVDVLGNNEYQTQRYECLVFVGD